MLPEPHLMCLKGLEDLKLNVLKKHSRAFSFWIPTDFSLELFSVDSMFRVKGHLGL